jgi:hypothetical protein
MAVLISMNSAIMGTMTISAPKPVAPLNKPPAKKISARLR